MRLFSYLGFRKRLDSRAVAVVLILAILVAGNRWFPALRLNVAKAVMNRGLALEDLVLIDESKRQFQQLMMDDNSFSAIIALGHIFVMRQEFESAIATWQQASTKSQIVDYQERWAVHYERRGDLDVALRWLEQSSQLAPNRADAWFHMGRLQEQRGFRELAMANYLIASETEQYDDVGTGDIAHRLGRLAYLENDWTTAIVWFDSAIQTPAFRQSDRLWEARYLRGESLRLSGKLDASRADFEATLELRPDHYWAHIRLAQVRWHIENNVNAAETLLKGAIAVDPDNKWAYRILGDLYHESGRIEAATANYRLAWQIDPRDGYVLDKLATLEID